jgi:hypothetical protein
VSAEETTFRGVIDCGAGQNGGVLVDAANGCGVALVATIESPRNVGAWFWPRYRCRVRYAVTGEPERVTRFRHLIGSGD